jgi:toxin CcdB
LRQFDVYEAPTEAARRIAPFVVVLQSHFLNSLPTVLVAPLLRQVERPAYADVSVAMVFDGEKVVLSLAEIAAARRADLRHLRGNLREHEDAIRRALERVFTGF